jgi:His-Xaa-Ser system radical SAM maturase HxsB
VYFNQITNCLMTDRPKHSVLPSFRYRDLDDTRVVIVSDSGDYVILSKEELQILRNEPDKISQNRFAEFKSKFFFVDPSTSGLNRLLASRIKTKHETVLIGPALHIIVPTLQCDHSCRYCQVSRSLDGNGYTMYLDDLNQACDSIFESPAKTLTIEFQGGEPLLRFDLVRYAIIRIYERNKSENRDIRFVVATTLHYLTVEMCDFFNSYGVYLSTSIDGPEELHNINRPIPTRDSYSRTVAGIELARKYVGVESVSALMTTTYNSLRYADEIVDTYVHLGFKEIFIRPQSQYGFARSNHTRTKYSHGDYLKFYERVFERVLYWNRSGVDIRESGAAIALNKILSPFDAGYVDLQNPSGAGLAAILYNYDGFVYPGDEARMIAERGDKSLRLGRIGDQLSKLLDSEVQKKIIASSLSNPSCKECVYNAYCGPDPIGAYNRHSSWSVPADQTEHCQHYMALFDFLFRKLQSEDLWFEDLAYKWASQNSGRREVPDAQI